MQNCVVGVYKNRVMIHSLKSFCPRVTYTFVRAQPKQRPEGKKQINCYYTSAVFRPFCWLVGTGQSLIFQGDLDRDSPVAYYISSVVFSFSPQYTRISIDINIYIRCYRCICCFPAKRIPSLSLPQYTFV